MPSGLQFLTENLRELGLELVPSAANFILVRVGEGQRVFDELQKLGSLCGRWAVINCRSGSAFPSARPRKMSAV